MNFQQLTEAACLSCLASASSLLFSSQNQIIFRVIQNNKQIYPKRSLNCSWSCNGFFHQSRRSHHNDLILAQPHDYLPKLPYQHKHSPSNTHKGVALQGLKRSWKWDRFSLFLIFHKIYFHYVKLLSLNRSKRWRPLTLYHGTHASDGTFHFSSDSTYTAIASESKNNTTEHYTKQKPFTKNLHTYF